MGKQGLYVREGPLAEEEYLLRDERKREGGEITAEPVGLVLHRDLACTPKTQEHESLPPYHFRSDDRSNCAFVSSHLVLTYLAC